MLRVIHFGLTADNPDRVVKFQSDVCHWEIDEWAGPVDCWLATTGVDDQSGINAIMKRQGISQAAVTFTIDVSSVDEDIIAIASTEQEVDTVAVIRPVNSSSFFDLRIKEILCKPYFRSSPTVKSSTKAVKPK